MAGFDTPMMLSPNLKTWAATVLGKIGGKPQSVTGDSEKQAKQRQRVRTRAGFEWHKADAPGKGTVGVRREVNPFNPTIITNMRIAGRPRGKHGGKQGQHTTAFAVNREVVVAACIGRTEAKAKESMAARFKTLLGYPAFADDTSGAQGDLKDLVAKLSDPKSTTYASYSLGDMATLYLEVRDALPGASLNTGIDGTASGSQRQNILGKGEGSILKNLRQMEGAAVGGGSVDDKAAAQYILALYDETSEDAAGLDAVDRGQQRRTFLMSAAQAFPGLYQRKAVRKALETALQDNIDAEQAKKLATEANTLVAVAQEIATGAGTMSRPQPPSFAALVDEKGRICFQGRPDSVKDSSTMGDHTTCEQLMKDAANGVMAPKGNATTNGALIDRLRNIKKNFNADEYSFFDIQVDDGYPDPFAAYKKRKFELSLKMFALDKLVQRLEGLDAMTPASAIDVAEAAELYMDIVDNRPTAVHYGAPAKNRGEQECLANIRVVENSKTRSPRKQDLLNWALGLFDSQAVMQCHSDFVEYDEDAAEEYVERVVAEFVYFLKNAYPRVYGIMEDKMEGHAGIVEAITLYCKDYGDMDNDDDAYEEKPKKKVKRTPKGRRYGKKK